MNYYIAYELYVCSDVEIPELSPWLNGSEEEADVLICEADIQKDQKEAISQVGPFLYVDTNNVFLEVPDIAQFWVESGRRIAYQMSEGSSEEDLRAFLLGSCIGALLMQRGLFLLHGSSIQIGEGCVVCVGHSTAGKSSLAAAFMQDGYSIVSDDVCAISAEGEVIPGIPRIKINQDIAQSLKINTDTLRTVRANCDGKFSLPLDKQFSSKRLPLLAIYEMLPEVGEVTIYNDLNTFECFSVLQKHLYRPRYSKAMGKAQFNLQHCGQIAASTRVSRIHRPRFQLTVKELPTLILQNLHQLNEAS
ncbi:hypothetical protein [Arenicella xantha]|uniref:Hpr(Ser) kinase/phosphatase n=1 Tax=Arenicella xantha TaxID=644221 RepID=A0A395JLP3_9GAMM|nr:hypothetical protein [Arenicella xantha]RBP49932.1 hypothetical protein DFR28_103364 [Arenicella xantha]